MSMVRGLGPICIDGRMLVDGATGVATYARNLIDALRRLPCERYVLRDAARPGDEVGRVGTALRGGSRKTRLIDNSGEAGFRAWQGRNLYAAAHLRFWLRRTMTPVRAPLPTAGIMHWTYPVPLYVPGWRNIYTVHDTIPIDSPTMSPVPGDKLGRMLASIIEKADRIVTVSEASRRQIIDYLRCDPGRVINCYQTIPPPISQDLPLPQGLKPDGYYLYCGTLETRKNVVRLIEAHRASGTKLPLVLAGPDGWGIDAIKPAFVDNDRVIRLAYLPRAELDCVIRQARALLHPSLAEGFGLPVVEAMSAAVPVLTSNRGALAEIAGNAAVLVDPESVPAIAAGIARLDTDAALRAELRTAGLRRAPHFSPRAFALRLERVYADLPDAAEKARAS